MSRLARRLQASSSLVNTPLPETIITVSDITSTTATLNWATVAGATGYLVGRDDTDSNGTGPYQTTDPAGTTSRQFISLLPNTTYTLYCQPLPGGVTQSVQITTSAQQAPDYGPISIASAAVAVDQLHAPAGASYVVWDNSWPNDLNTVFFTYLGVDDILVLPERAEPYYVDTSNGFMYDSNVASWSDGALLVHHGFMFGEMAHARRGILGLGPGAVVALKPSSFTQGPQGDSSTRYYTDTSGVKHYENGCWEKIIGCGHAAAYFGNFTMAPSLDFGGVAYNGIGYGGQDGNTITFERIYAQGAHRGFASVPNGETGTITMNHGTYEVYNCEIDCRLPDGTAVGTSPIMWNNMLGGTVDTCYFHHSYKGMATFWSCGGTNAITNVRSEYMNSTSWNLEDSRAGVVYNFTGGSMMIGGKPYQFQIGAYGSSATVTCRGVSTDLSKSATPGYFCISEYGGTNNQIDSNISILDGSGNPVPTKITR